MKTADRSFRTTTRRRVVAFVQAVSLVALTLGSFVAQSAPANAYQALTAAWSAPVTGATDTTTSTDPGGTVVTVTTTGLTDLAATTTLGARGWDATQYTPTNMVTGDSAANLLVNTGTCAITGTCPNLGTVTVSFSQPVTNPVIHLAGIGGTSTGTTAGVLTAQSDLHSVYTLTTPGVTISKLDGNAQLSVTGGNTITATNDSTSGNCTTNVNTAPTANAAGSAACGSVQVNGTVTTVAFNVSAIFVQNNAARPGSNGATTGDGVALAVTLPEDFSDAPTTYNPTQAPSHIISDLKLGATVDEDNVNVRNATVSPYSDAAASGDGADEDAFTTLPDVTGLAGNTYSLTVPVSGVSKNAQLCGYIDFNKGGTFDTTSERACVGVAAGATSAVLTWTVPATVVLGTSYARLRLGYTAAQVQAPTGRADSGEVEDYPVVIKYAPSCSFLYGLDWQTPANPRKLYQIDPATGASVAIASFADTMLNALALDKTSGNFFFAAQAGSQTTVTLSRFDPATGVRTNYGPFALGATITSGIYIGAINPVNGLYYLGGTDASSINHLYVFNPTTNTWVGEVGRFPMPSGRNNVSDITFDADGVMYFTADSQTGVATSQLWRTSSPVPSVTSTATIPTVFMNQTAGNVPSAGALAFGPDGYLYRADLADTIYKMDPASGAQVSATTLSQSAAYLGDLASCAVPSTIKLQKTLPSGRYAAGDQFALSITGGGLTTGNTGTTAGTETGLQNQQTTEIAGPVLGLGGTTYTIAETASGTTVLTNYAITWDCVISGTGTTVASGSGATGTFTMPNLGSSGGGVVCTITNAPIQPAITVVKSHGTPSGATAGSTVVYSFLVTNTGNVPLTSVGVTDPKVTSVLCPVSTLAVAASTTCTATYTLTQADINAGVVNNTATATGTAPNAVVVTATSSDVLSIARTAALTLDKQAGTPSGNTVGSTIAYTFVVTNTGNVTLNPVTVTDPKVGTLSCPTSTLTPGATTSCTGTYTLTATDVDAGHVANTATATGTPPAGVTPAPSATDSTDTVIPSNPAITVDKQAGTPSGSTAGSTIAYTFTVVNTGNVTLTTVAVNDPKLGGAVTCAATTLAAGASTTCGPVSYTLTQADVDAGHVANTATATGKSPTGATVTGTDSTDTSIVASPALTVDKTHDALTGTGVAGTVVTYHFLVKNTGNVTLTSVGVTDAKVGSVTCSATTLLPNASTNCSATYTLTQADVDAGVVNNTATASGTQPVTAANPNPSPVTATDTDVLQVPAVPSLTVDKTHVAPTVFAAGTPVSYTFTVKNTGNVTLNAVAVTDPKIGAVTCPATTLAPGASTVCTGTYALTQADLDAGVVNNTATASGKQPSTAANPNPTPVTGTDTDTLPLTQSPKLTLDKQAGTPSGNTAGSTILYTFVVTNTGNVTLNPVTVSDSKVGVVTCAPASLAPGASVSCTKTYVITQADINSGHVPNSATASGTPPTGPPVTGTDSTDTPLTATPSLTIDKQAGVPSSNTAGGTIAYAFVVTNTGNVTLTSVGVTDAKVGTVTCPVATLVPGASTTCTATYTLTQADVNSGHVANTATVSGTPPTGGPVTGTDSTDTPIAASPKLVLDKTAGTPSGNTAGSTITYTLLVTNTGNVTLDPIAFSDPKVSTASCSTAALAVGASRSCTVTYTLTQADVDAGHVANTATATGTPPGVGATPVTATDSTDTPVAPGGALTLTKTAGTPSGTNAGDMIDYTFVVTNTGNVTLTSVSVGDSKITTLSCTAATLAPGAQFACFASYQLTQADVDAGTVHNDATATGNPPTGAPLTATSFTDTPIPATPAITLDKQASAPTALIAGSTIDYTFLVTNTGNVTLTFIGISDPKVGPVTCPVTTLQPTASTTCVKTYTLTQADVDAGQVVNNATATGTPPTGAPVTGTDTTTTLIAANPGIVLDKQAGTPTGNKAGDTVPYTFLVTNSGTVTLTGILLSDTKVGAVSCPLSSLNPAETMTCTATYTLLQSDVDAGHVTNSATVFGAPPAGAPVSATDTTDTPIAESPNLTLVKSAGTPTPDNKAGSTVAYTFLVTNTGNVTMTLVGVTDAKVGAVTCPVTALNPTESATCTGTYTLTQADVDAGQVVNTATAHGTSPLGTVKNSDPSTVNTTVPADPKIVLDKQAGAPSTNAVGGTIAYTFVVTNTGNVTLDPIAISDTKVGTVTCPITSLAPGASTTCSKSYSLLQSDVDAGTVHNSATATGLSPKGVSVQSVDAVDTPVAADPKLTLDKQAGVPTGGKAGDTISYTLLVKNTGNVTLDPIAFSDAKVDTSTCSTAALAVGDSRSCTVSYTLTQADVDAGHVANTATVTGTPPVTPANPTPTPTTATDSTDTPVASAAAIALVKTAGAPSGTTAGSTVPYSFLVTNTGNVTLTAILVTDSKVGAVNCPATTLLPGASTTCTATYTMSQTDVDAGTVHNDASVDGNPPTGGPVTASSSTDTPIAAAPALTLDKQAGAPSANAVGGTIAYTFIVKNTGNVTLSDVGVVDPKVGAVTCPVTSLAPGVSTTCTASYTLLQSDVDAATVHNSATASGTQPITVANPNPSPVTAVDAVDVPVTAAPAITLDKQAGAPSANIVGGTIAYTFLVTNTGNVTLSSVKVTDAKVGTVACPVAVLAPGASTTCTATYTLLQSDVDAENVYNFATASGTQPVTAATPTPTPVTASDAVNVPVISAPAITLDKAASAPSANTAGATIDYTFLVTNSGNVTLGSISVADAKVGAVNCPDTTLIPGASTTCTATYTLTQADVDAGTVHNSATVTGLPPATAGNPNPAPVTATDAVDVPVPADPKLTLDKTHAAPATNTAGATVAYSFLVTNTGNVTMSSVSVSDPKVGTVSCPVTSLLPGASTTCTASYTLLQSDVDAGVVDNTATASGTQPATPTNLNPTPVTVVDTDTLPLPTVATLTVDKTHVAPATNTAGATVAYSFLVTNTGNVTLTSVGVADTKMSSVSCPVASLLPGASTTCTASYTLTQADVDAGVVLNTATASGTPPVTVATPVPTPVTAVDTDTLPLPAAPAMTLDKQASGPATNTAGATISYTFLVTNTGNVTLSSVAVADAKVGTVTCPLTTLAPAASTTCTASYTLTQADVDAGTVHNSATASGTPPVTVADPNPTPVTATDTVDVPVPAAPSVVVDKQASAPSAMVAGGTIDYTFLVENTGNVTLDSVVVLDAKVGGVSCPTATLLPVGSMLCTATYTITQADVDAGHVANTATAQGTPPATPTNPSPAPVTGSDSTDTPLLSSPAITLDKTAAAPSANVAGGTIAYSFLVTNTGNVTLTAVAVTDAKVGTVVCPDTTLAPAAATTCTATYTLTQADVDAGTVHNSASVAGTPPTGAPVTATDAVDVPVPAAPVVTLAKTAAAPSANVAGGTVAYSFLVTNTGNVTLDTVTVTDVKVGAVVCPDTTLAPAASTTCTATYTLTQADVDAGTVHNDATASGTPPVTAANPIPTPVTATDAVDLPVPAAPAVTVDKTAAAPSANAVGGTIAYSFLVTNTGNVTLDTVGVTDAKVGAVLCPDTTLAPGASTTCTATYTLTQADVDAGTVHNDATASGMPPVTLSNPNPSPATGTDAVDVPITAAPAVTLVKQGSAPSVNAAGGTISYTFLVTNTGNVTLGSIVVADALVGPVTCPDTTLIPGASTTCTATYTLTPADVDAGTVHNSATVTGLPPATPSNPNPTPATATDAVDVAVTAAPAIDLAKTATAPTANVVGATIDYTFVVTNIGNVTLTSVGVSDPKVGPVACPLPTLAPGAGMSCTVTYTLTQADVDAGNVHNSATASGTPPVTAAQPVPVPVTAVDAVDVPVAAAPAITLVKSAGAPSANAVGATIAYSFLVTNTGNVTLSSIAVSDPKVGAVSCPVTTLAPGVPTTCTATYTLTQADVDAGTVLNTATASGLPPVTATNPVPVSVTANGQVQVAIPAAPSFTFDKQAGTPSGFNSGDTILYSFVVTNTGNVTLSSIAISDATVGTITCPVTALAPAATTICTATYTLTQTDVDGGHVANTATVTATPPVTVANPTPDPLTATDQTDTAIPPTPSLSLVKQAGPHTNTAGSPVVYSFLVANTGNVTMSKVGVLDAKIANISCPKLTLAPGESMTCTGTYVLTAADVKAGKVSNTARATGILASCLVSGGSVGGQQIKANGICDPIVSDESIVVFAMPNTGSSVSPWEALGALALMAVGGALVLTGRRRNRV